jgi:hypothetical protein
MAKYFAENTDGETVKLKGKDLHKALGEFIFELSQDADVEDAQFDFLEEDDDGESFLIGIVRKEDDEVSFSPV